MPRALPVPSSTCGAEAATPNSAVSREPESLGPPLLRPPNCGRAGRLPHERGPRGATGPRGRERAAAASSSPAPARGGGASPARSGFKRRLPTPRRTRRSGAARACRCHASARAASARVPAAAPGHRCRARRRARRPARAPAARTAPLALAASARAARRLLRAAAAAPRLHQPLGSASAGRPRRGGPRGCGARLPQLGPGEYRRPRAPQTFPAAGGHARGGALPARPPEAPRGKATRTAGDGGGALRGFAGSAVGHSAGKTWWFAWTVPREGPRPWVPRRCRRALALGSVASEALIGRRHLPNRSGVDAQRVAAFCQPAPSSASTQFPVASRAQAPPLRLLCPRRVARGSGLGARAKAVRRWLGDLSVAGNSGTGFPLA